MPTPTKGPRLGAGPAHERLLLSGLATALFEHGRITTTVAKAKRLRPLAERLVTKARRGDLHARRQVLSVIRDKSVAHALFAEIGPRYENRPGGYTRITKIGPRKGDNAPMAVIELVEPLTVAQQAVTEATAATRRSARDRAGTPTAAPAAASSAAATSAAPTSAAAAEPAATAENSDDGPQQVPAEDPAEGSTSPQTESAGETEPAEGQPVEGQPVEAEPAAEPGTGEDRT